MKQEYEENENTIGYRITELRKDRGLSQKEVADRIHVSSSQISRIESGNTVDVNNDILIALAQLFHVSTDYLLGLTRIQEPRNYDIAQVQLSEKAVKKMMSGTIDMDVLNRILEHERFPALCTQIRYYFDDTIADGIAGRNEIIALATGPLSELKAADPSRRTEIIKDLRLLNSQKIGSHEIDIEKITKDFIKILRDVKDSIQNHEPTDAVATSEIIQKIQNALSDKPRQEITPDDIANAIVALVSSVLPMNEKCASLLHETIIEILKQSELSIPENSVE